MQAQPKTVKAAALESWQRSLRDARQIVKAVLGHDAAATVAEHHSGIYRGLIIGQTRDYVIQQIGNQLSAVIHAKNRFYAANRESPWPEVGHAFSIHYSRSHAIAREVRDRPREQERNR